jgi:HD superfamily phosphohydrolase
LNYQKTIHDAIYGSIDLDGYTSSIISTKEFQRLSSIKQLGFTYLVFPGATHSRFEHSLGTYFLSREAAVHIGLSEEDIRLVSLAGLLHDIGHSPFSHSLEDSMVALYGKDHLDATVDILEGKTEGNEISDVLGQEKREIIAVLRGKKGILSRLISGNGDADQIDYLARDSYYTGVALGTVDVSRILRTLVKCGDELCIKEKGLPSMEGLMIGRMLMYKSVYRHRTGLVAGSIANDALRIIEPDYDDLVKWNDCDFMSELKRNKNTVRFYEMLKYRRLPRGLIIRENKENFMRIRDELEGEIITSQYFVSPFKSEILKVKTEKGEEPITNLSSIMEFLQRELVEIGLLVYDPAKENLVKSRLSQEGIKY